jgi:Arc/MetJ-type ribon-helix-helix transcriptional regulator
MKVVTVRLDEDLVDALDAEAEEAGFRNRTEYVRNLLRNRERIRENTPENTKENTREYEALEDRLAELEARVEELEAGGGVDRDARPTAVAGGGDRAEGDSEAVREGVLAELGDGPPRKRHARAAVADAVALLVDRGPLETGELKTELWATYDEHYSSKKGMWESVNRYLKDVDGVSKPGYGEYDAER